MKVDYINLSLKNSPIKNDILKEIEKVIDSGWYINGPSNEIFERRFAKLSGTKYAVGVANGMDALIISLKALDIGVGDEVITPPNSYVATTTAIMLVGAKPVFVDVDYDLNINTDLIESKITNKTKAIIPVHLTGKPAKVDILLSISKKYGISIIEDCAQAVGAEFNKKRVGSFGVLGCFSLHPLKNLGALGDGGVITCNDLDLYEKIKILKNHGLVDRGKCVLWSSNSRLDNIQAAILNIKINEIHKWNSRRIKIAEYYSNELRGFVDVPINKIKNSSIEIKSVYHTYIIKTKYRNELKEFLFKNGIDSKIHYPIPIHLQEASKSLNHKIGDFPMTDRLTNEILSLPVYPELTDSDIKFVAQTIKNFFKNKQ